MNTNIFVDPAFSARICQTLLHSVWQVALLTLATWVIDRLARKRSVERSYALQVAALFLGLAAMPITYVLIDPARTPLVPIETALQAPDSRQATRVEELALDSAVAAGTAIAESGQTAIEAEISATSLVSSPTGLSSGTWSTEKLSRPWPQIAPWIVALYVIGVAVMFARLILAIVKANQLGSRARLVTDGPLIATLRSLADKWSMTAVPALAQAEQIVVPQIVGLIRPTILLPASAISGLSIGDLEMVLAHELAHVRRHDMWVNLLQRVAETLLFFNPALWYLSRRISTLREYCCDEVTCRTQSAAVSEPHLRYAAALLRVAELSHPASSADLAVLSAQGRSPSELRRRVARLFGEPLREPLRFSRGSALTLITLAFVLAIGPTVWTSRAHTAAGLNRGLTVTGTVTDELGQPIEGALIRTKFLNDIREARTDKTGVYRLVGCEPRMARIVASAKGRATDMQEVRVDPDLKPVNFSMKPGGQIRIRVVDEQGQGIPKARIFFQRWRGRIDYFEFDHVSQYTDENGVWQWNEAPLDEFQADICRPDGMQLSKQSLIARDEEYVFKPPRALVVSGSVVDAKTKKPIEKFRVIPGLRNSDPGIRMNWIPGDSYEASNGDYRIRLTHAYPAHLVRIEAEGYKVAISRDIMTDEGEVDVDFELHAAEDIAAAILTATGEPAGLARVALGVAGSQISINRGDIDAGSTYATQLDSDVNGRFSIPARDEPFQIVITHPAGFAYLTPAEGPIPRRITLTPWARVEGTFRVGADPAPNVVLSMYAEGIHSYGDDVPNIFTHHDVTTGKDGRFIFERVFPGKGRIGRRILLMVDDGATEVTSSQRISAEFIAGQTTTLALGGTGRPVVGKLAPPADHAERVLWNFALINVQADISPPPPPTAPEEVQNDPAKRQAWWDAWKATKAGKGWTYAYEAYEQIKSASPYITASVDRDGSFRIDDVPQGAYVLSVRFSKESPGALSGYRFSVPAVEQRGAADRVELGTLTLDRQ